MIKDGRLYVSNSLLGDIATCSTKAHLAWHSLLKPNGPEGAPLVAGTAVHKAMEVHFNGGSYDEAMGAFITSYLPYSEANIIDEKDRLHYDNVKIILRRWLQENPVEKFPFVPISGFAERTLAHPLNKEGDIWMYGTPDLIAEDRNNRDALVVIDNKSTGNIAQWWRNAYWLKSQQIGYSWLTANVLGRAVGMTYVNALQLDKLPDSVRKCKEHGVPHTECREYHASWRLLGPFTYTPEAIEEWRLSALHLAKRYRDLILTYPFTSDLRRVRTQGQFNGGCTFCNFSDFCRAGRPTKALSMLFQPSTRHEDMIKAALTADTVSAERKAKENYASNDNNGTDEPAPPLEPEDGTGD